MRVVIVDDHALFRDGLRSLLEAHGVDVVGESANGRDASIMYGGLSPDIQGGEDFPVATIYVKQHLPQLDRS